MLRFRAAKRPFHAVNESLTCSAASACAHQPRLYKPVGPLREKVGNNKLVAAFPNDAKVSQASGGRPALILEAGSARALPWTRIGDGEMFEPASLNALSTSSQLHLVLRAILAIRRPLIN